MRNLAPPALRDGLLAEGSELCELRLADSSVKAATDFIIIGAMKCATSTLYYQLARQDGIFMTTPKEPNFFSDDDRYAMGVGWYERLFEAARPGEIRGEASTHYTKLPTHPTTVERMRAHLPSVKLIYVMRHPVDRLVSQYIHEWTERTIDVSIEDAIDRYPHLVSYSMYSRQLQPYLDVYPREQILPVFFERLTAHPQHEFARICRFINYRGSPSWDLVLGARNVSLERPRLRPWLEALLTSPVLTRVRRRLIPKSARRWALRRWTIGERPHIPRGRSEQLRKVFDVDLATLGSWLGVELTCDNFCQTVGSRPLQWSGLAVSDLV